MIASFEIRAGRLALPDVRYLLDRMKLSHPDLNYVESGGVIEHRFAVRGNLEHIERIKVELEWLEE